MTPVSKRLPSHLLKSTQPHDIVIDAKQLSARGGEMQCRLADGKAKLIGKAWETGRGTLTVFE
jgi:hypothetical protein